MANIGKPDNIGPKKSGWKAGALLVSIFSRKPAIDPASQLRLSMVNKLADLMTRTPHSADISRVAKIKDAIICGNTEDLIRSLKQYGMEKSDRTKLFGVNEEVVYDADVKEIVNYLVGEKPKLSPSDPAYDALFAQYATKKIERYRAFFDQFYVNHPVYAYESAINEFCKNDPEYAQMVAVGILEAEAGRAAVQVEKKEIVPEGQKETIEENAQASQKDEKSSKEEFRGVSDEEINVATQKALEEILPRNAEPIALPIEVKAPKLTLAAASAMADEVLAEFRAAGLASAGTPEKVSPIKPITPEEKISGEAAEAKGGLMDKAVGPVDEVAKRKDAELFVRDMIVDNPRVSGEMKKWFEGVDIMTTELYEKVLKYDLHLVTAVLSLDEQLVVGMVDGKIHYFDKNLKELHAGNTPASDATEGDLNAAIKAADASMKSPQAAQEAKKNQPPKQNNLRRKRG
jgi:hypothetical protein